MDSFLYNFVSFLFTALYFAMVARVLLSWLPISPDSPIVAILNEITDPILRPLRRVVPSLGMIDLTPMVAIFLLWFIQNLLLGMIAGR